MNATPSHFSYLRSKPIPPHTHTPPPSLSSMPRPTFRLMICLSPSDHHAFIHNFPIFSPQTPPPPYPLDVSFRLCQSPIPPLTGPSSASTPHPHPPPLPGPFICVFISRGWTWLPRVDRVRRWTERRMQTQLHLAALDQQEVRLHLQAGIRTRTRREKSMRR